MRELIERGYISIAQSLLLKSKRKKKEPCIENDSKLNKILLELGSEDVSLIRAWSGYLFNREHSSKMIDAFSRLEMFRQSLIRHNCSLSKYLDQHECESEKLLKYTACMRTGSAEGFKVLFNEDARGVLPEQRNAR
jgi:DNA gyrase subunit B